MYLLRKRSNTMGKDNVVGLTPDQVQGYRQDRKNVIEYADALDRLRKNPDFIKVFMKGYIEEESTRCTLLLGATNYSSVDEKNKMDKIYMDNLVGIGLFDQYMRGVYARATMAEKELESLAEAETEYYKGLKKE